MSTETSQRSEPLDRLIAAAVKLAERNLIDISGHELIDQNLAECVDCGRRRRGDAFDHAENCLTGKVLRAVQDVRSQRLWLAQPLWTGLDLASEDAAVPHAACAGMVDDEAGEAEVECSCGVVFTACGDGCKASVRKLLDQHIEDSARDPLLSAMINDGLIDSDKSWEGSAAVQAPPERRVVCGAEWPIGDASGFSGVWTCDREPGHDADPNSNHWTREGGFSWPTAAKIRQEMNTTCRPGLSRTEGCGVCA